jgi:hypothetical protein
MAILGVWFFGSELFKPNLEVVVQAGLVIVYEDAGGYVHRVAKHETFLNTAFGEAGLDIRRDIDKFPSVSCIKP